MLARKVIYWLKISLPDRFPRMSTMRPASLPTVLEPEQAVTQRSSRKLFVPPLPTMPRPVPDSTSMCTGGSLASVVCWVCPPEANQGPEGPLAVSHGLLDFHSQPFTEHFCSHRTPVSRGAALF